MLKKFLQKLLYVLYKVEIRGLENYAKAGDRVLIIANHISFLDPLLLGVYLPGDVTFAINTHIARQRWIKPFLRLSQVFEMDPTNPLSLKALIQHLKQNRKAIIFPEGRITVTGSLMKIYDGTGMVADKSEAMILPIRLDGAEYTHFSRLRNLVRLRLFPKITINVLPPTRLKIAAEIHGKERRKLSGRVLADMMTEMMFVTSHYRQTIFSALLEARHIHGGRHEIVEDMERKPLNYDRLITRTIAVADLLRDMSETGENLGVLLPNSLKTLTVVLGLQLYGRVPAMLNYSIGYSGMLSACRTARIQTVFTSRLFVEKARLHDDIEHLSRQTRVVYLEDLAKRVTLWHKLRAVAQSTSANYWYKHRQFSPDAPAVILFTSGTEGAPKGVVLSHANILANHKQLGARVSFTAQDFVLNVLPMFHSFGFTIGTLFPVLSGIKAFLYPSPLHYSVIPEIAYEINATMLFGTNTFLAAYGKKAHAYDFYSMRYVFAGAEKLQDSTRATWADKFGIRILEGYGVTETSPVLAVNTPMECTTGTVGRLMPSVQYRLESVEGIAKGGKLHVSGPNIMLGYLLPDNPGQLVASASIYGNGWYDTGDIVEVNAEGYITICGRSKRFAKISGEMVSLAVPEQLAAQLWPDAQHAVVALPDSRKGEQLIMMTTHKGACNQPLADAAKGLSLLHIPKVFITVERLPVLATGKTDYQSITALAGQHLVMLAADMQPEENEEYAT
ncbi:MAG: AMP-binding protein [Gammaproteobacteria bacterium]